MIPGIQSSEAKKLCILEKTVQADEFTLRYRLFESVTQTLAIEQVSCFDLEIALESTGSTPSETVLLEDISEDLQKAAALTELFARENVMPCTALEVMEDLLAGGELSEELLFG